MRLSGPGAPAGSTWSAQIAITASIDYGLAAYIGFLITLYSSSFTATARWILVIYAYVFSIRLLLAQYTLTGYDASAHMTEETQGADSSGPKSIVRSINVSIIAAFWPWKTLNNFNWAAPAFLLVTGRCSCGGWCRLKIGSRARRSKGYRKSWRKIERDLAPQGES
jgi:hypothetical protein